MKKREPDHADYRARVDRALEQRSRDLGRMGHGVLRRAWGFVMRAAGRLALPEQGRETPVGLVKGESR